MNEFAGTLSVINSEPRPAQLLRDKVAQGQLGAKTGQGFERWEEGARMRAAAHLSEHVATRLRERAQSDGAREIASQPLLANDELIARRLRVAVWREAIALVANKVCASGDVDRVVCNTIGLRLANMGPVKNADYVGLDLTLAIHEAVLPSLESSTQMPATVRANVI
jgi:3-hydroxyacyl-CoA dehydrogenase